MLINLKEKTYNLILVIIDWLIKITQQKLVKIIINAFGLAKIIINIIICHYNF